MPKNILTEVAVKTAVEIISGIISGIKMEQDKQAELSHNLKVLEIGYQQLMDENKSLKKENEGLRDYFKK